MNTTDLADLLGPVALYEYERVADDAKPRLVEYAQNLQTMPDAEFVTQAAAAIWDAVQTNRFPGYYEEACKASIAYHLAGRRYQAAGHDKDCRGDTLYVVAYNRVLRDYSTTVRPAAPVACTCGAV